MSIVAVPVVRVQNSAAQHSVIRGYRLGQIQRQQRDIVLVVIDLIDQLVGRRADRRERLPRSPVAPVADGSRSGVVASALLASITARSAYQTESSTFVK
jgi:hypothetical protein